MDDSKIEPNHPYANFPYLWEATFSPPELADPDEPQRVQRTRLEKIDLGKSSNSCKVALITRLHRSTVLQEIWCASFEEAEVYKNVAGNPDVVNFKEQLTRVDFLREDGSPTHTLVDLHVLFRDGTETLVSVKYDEKAKRQAYLAEVESIARQCSPEIADRFVVASRYSFHPKYRKCAEQIHMARRGWDPEADRIVLEAANDEQATFTFRDLTDRAKIGGRGWRAAVRLIGDGDIGKGLLDPFEPQTILRRIPV
ncbi:MAG: hypothetical protein ACI9TZ_002894 [Yoonia sp.]|jgi:hypothetical protein